mgnify:FL=1
MRNVWLTLLLVLPGLTACSESNDTPDDLTPEPPITENIELSIVDKNATSETKALYANLWEIQQRG